MSYRIASYRVVSYRIASYRIVSYRVASYFIVSHRISSYLILSHRIVSRSHRISSYLIVSHRISSYLIVSLGLMALPATSAAGRGAVAVDCNVVSLDGSVDAGAGPLLHDLRFFIHEEVDAEARSYFRLLCYAIFQLCHVPVMLCSSYAMLQLRYVKLAYRVLLDVSSIVTLKRTFRLFPLLL